ncbi:MAG TPA: hypothetical protein VGB55_06770 [Tepidisphaeraceae bacterium]
MLRLARIAAVFIGFVLVLGLLVLATWPQEGLVALATRGQDNLLMGLVLGQLLVMILAVPGVASVQLTEEKEGNTLEMLYATRLSAFSITLGKLMSAIAFPVMLLLAGLPFMALLNYRGDVDQAAAVQCYGVLALAAILLAVLSLAVSAVCRTSATALVVAYLITLIFCGAVLIPALIMLDVQEGPVAVGLHYLRSISPVAAILSILRPAFNDMGGAARQNLPAWQPFIGFSVVTLLVSTGIIVRRLSTPPVDADTGGVGGVSGNRSMARKLMFLIDDKKQRKPMGSFNPLIAKERRTNQLRSGRWMIRIFYGSAVLGLGLALMAMSGGSEHENVLLYVATIIVALQFAILALVTPSLTSPVISSELEAGTFEMLRMTPLGAGRIFWGKFIPAFLPALLPVIALIPAWIVVGFVNQEYIRYAIALLPITGTALLLCSTVGLTASAFNNSSARATVVAYLIVAAIFVLPMIAWWTSGTLLSPALAAPIAMVSPLAIALDMRPILPDLPLTRDWFVPHLITIGSICAIGLLAAALRLRQLMRQG